MRTFGPQIVWGVPETVRPILNLPGDAIKIRVRFRNKDLARVFVKTPDGIRHFIITVVDGEWTINYELEQGRNWRPFRVRLE